MAATDELFQRIYAERKVNSDLKRITVPPELYEAAYLEMHRFFLQPGEIVESVNGQVVPVTRYVFPLPVPESSYVLWGADVVKAD